MELGIITPTYILFTPYILDQGNRILREFLPSIYLSMLCGFKMDNFEEGRWGNKFLIEYIKYVMEQGFFLGAKKFRFFNFSQSQFRNMSCWLLTEPEKILEKTGDYSNIKIVAKFGSRVSQTLTTTIKTIKIPNDHIVYINDDTFYNRPFIMAPIYYQPHGSHFIPKPPHNVHNPKPKNEHGKPTSIKQGKPQKRLWMSILAK